MSLKTRVDALGSVRLLAVLFSAALVAACSGSSGATNTNCGNGVLDPGEQCDDGNTASFDGCSATCQLEESQRVNWLKLQFATDSACTTNALGNAVVQSLAQSQLQTALDKGIKDGSITILLEFLGASDVTGVDQSGITLGVLGGRVESTDAGTGYDGTSDLDWWYQPDQITVAASGEPLAQLPASISNHTLTAGPGSVSLNLSLGGAVTAMSVSHASLNAPIGTLSTPLESTNGGNPGHLPSEHVAPSLQTFSSLGATQSSGAATLCGNVAAASLSKALLPSIVVSSCAGLTSTSTALDLIVSGCVAFGSVHVVTPTQPDQVDAAQPAAGAGAPYTLSASSGTSIDTCKDKNGTVVSNLEACLNAATYSSYFKFASDRVIVR